MQYRDLNRMHDKGDEVGSVDGGLESSVKIEVDFRRNRSCSRLGRLYIFLRSWLLVSMQNNWNVNVLKQRKVILQVPMCSSVAAISAAHVVHSNDWSHRHHRLPWSCPRFSRCLALSTPLTNIHKHSAFVLLSVYV